MASLALGHPSTWPDHGEPSPWSFHGQSSLWPALLLANPAHGYSSKWRDHPMASRAQSTASPDERNGQPSTAHGQPSSMANPAHCKTSSSPAHRQAVGNTAMASTWPTKPMDNPAHDKRIAGPAHDHRMYSRHLKNSGDGQPSPYKPQHMARPWEALPFARRWPSHGPTSPWLPVASEADDQQTTSPSHVQPAAS
jgi:hypothetical protein